MGDEVNVDLTTASDDEERAPEIASPSRTKKKKPKKKESALSSSDNAPTKKKKKKKKKSSKKTKEIGTDDDDGLNNEDSNNGSSNNNNDTVSGTADHTGEITSSVKKKKSKGSKKIVRSSSEAPTLEFSNNIRDSISCLTENTHSSTQSKTKKATPLKKKQSDISSSAVSSSTEGTSSTSIGIAQKQTPSTSSSHPTITRKKSNQFANGTVKLKILPDGTTRISVPKQPSQSLQLKKVSDRDEESDDSDLDGNGPTILTKRSISPRRIASKSPETRRRTSGDRSSNTNTATPKQKRNPPRKIRSLSRDKDSSNANASRASSKRRPEPVRFSARRGSDNVRSFSADHLTEMKALANSNSSSSSSASCSKTKKIPKREVHRHSSDPFSFYRGGKGGRGRGREGRGRGRGPPPKKTHAKPKRRGSKDLTASEHVQMLNEEKKRRPLRRSYSEDAEMRKSGSRRRNSSAKPSSTSLSPTRMLSSSSFSSANPKSILRNSSHHKYPTDDLSKNSNHSVTSARSRSVGFSNDSLHSSDVDDSDIDSSGEFNNDDSDSTYEGINDRDTKGNDTLRSARTTQLSQQRSRRPNGLWSGLSQGASLLGLTNHSSMSIHSMFSNGSKEEFEDDPWWKAGLRYMRLLPPHKNETSLKKKIRIFTWLSMMLDFIAALVAVITYSGSTMCCGEPLFDLLLDINWDALFRAVTILYLLLIFAEIIPVIKKGMPFNIVNPTIGFVITFGMFFDDSIAEAVAMWVIEAMAIFFEFLVYRVNARIYFETCFRLKQVDEDLENLKKSRRRLLDLSRHSASTSQNSLDDDAKMDRMAPKSRSSVPLEIPVGRASDDESLSGHSFEDDDFEDEIALQKTRSTRMHAQSGRMLQSGRITRNLSRPDLDRGSMRPSAHSSETGERRLVGEIKQNRLLRKRRILRENKKKEEVDLNYHFVGTILNVGMAVFALLLIITIASTGGLCFKNDSVKIFSFDQLGKCNACKGDEVCEVCNLPEGNQCYYPYY